MAYDPKDPADKKIVDKLIADAIEAREAELETEHEDAVKGLKDKNRELIQKNKDLKAGKGDPADVEKLEAEIETLQKTVKDGAKALKDITKERDALKTGFESESAASRKLLVDQGLTENLIANNVAKEFLPAAKALLAGQVTIKADGDNRVAMVGDKPLSDFVKTWSQGDEGKHYVKAPANGGGNAPGGSANGSGTGKVIARSAYEANPSAYAADLRGGATIDPAT